MFTKEELSKDTMACQDDVVIRVEKFLRANAFIFNFSNIKMVKDSVIDNFPTEWIQFLRSSGFQKFKGLLNQSDLDSQPSSLVSFVRQRHRLVADMEQLLFEVANFNDLQPATLKNCKGMRPKKSHEVDVMTEFMHAGRCRHHLSEKSGQLVVDVGSGVGHLGRSLNNIGFRVIGLERDRSHNDNAKKRTAKAKSHENLVVDVEDSDASRQELNRLLDEHPLAHSEGYWTVALHACGDLSPAILKWFCSSKSTELVLVSCCYHKMTTAFPMSQRFRADMSDPQDALKSQFALRLACQEHFEKWLEYSHEEHVKRSQYLGFRCLLEELTTVSSAKKVKRRAVRKGQMETFEDFVENALARFEFFDGKETRKKEEIVKIKSELNRLYADHQPDFQVLEMIVGLQAFLQKLLEFMVLFDRKIYLEENQLNAVILRMFDPIISPRCFAINCQKSIT